MSLTINNWIVCWTPANVRPAHPDEVPGNILVARLGDDVYQDKRYSLVTGCCESNHHETPDGQPLSLYAKVATMFIDFHTCVVRDGIDPQAAHREFLKIDEYRRRIAQDVSGATNKAEI